MKNFQIAKKNSFVTRQTLASWENGESIPQIKKIEMLKEQGINVDKFVLPAMATFNNLLSKPFKSVPSKENSYKVCEK